jgi:hypothetical protein
MAVTNAEIKSMIEKWASIIRDNQSTLERIAPMVENHEKILHGDKGDRKDEGIVGVINNVDDMVTSIKSWVKPIALTIITTVVLGGLAKLIEVIYAVDAMIK